MSRHRVVQYVYAIDGDKMKYRNNWGPRKGGNGFGLSDEGVMYTLNTIDAHMVGIIYGYTGETEESRREQHGVCQSR